MKNAQELLKKSFLTQGDLPDRGVELRIRPADYPFFIRMFHSNPKINREIMLEDFHRYLSLLCRNFMSHWLQSRLEQEAPKVLEKFEKFKEGTNYQKAFERIIDGGDTPAELYLPIGNARLIIRRLGNCLGLKLFSNNTPPRDEVHVHGTELLQSFCDEGSNHIQELLHSIECIVPLPRKHGENNSVTIDLGRVFAQIEKACLYFGWKKISENINMTLASYTTPPNPNIFNGPIAGWHRSDKCALTIHTVLVHYNNRKETESPQWRRGNFEQIDPNSFRFYDGRDLCLSLRVCGSLQTTTFLQNIDPELDIDSEQDALLLAGATLYSQLCAMMANSAFGQ